MGSLFISSELSLTVSMTCLGIAVISLAYFFKGFWTAGRPSYKVLYGLLTLFAIILMQFFKSGDNPVPTEVIIFGVPLLMACFAIVMVIERGHH